MIFNWYKIFNRVEFEALGLVSKPYVLDLEDLGEKTFLATKGNIVSVVHEGVMLGLGLHDQNPFVMDGFGIFEDPDTNDVFFGYLVEEET